MKKLKGNYYENPWFKVLLFFICLYNSLTLDITDFLRKNYFFIFPYVPPQGEQKGEQILQIKKGYQRAIT
ncbi:hypothetical protein [Streptococcus suis]|uniref:hypothetical protein n=1 Tax=Streptococcus suis TaxID=1307 RepID=UPI000943F8EE|nr:hypothetical protein [Streptococcus suis]